MTQTAPHSPVLLNEVIAALAPAAGEIYFDGTFGAGGYSRALLDAAACSVVAVDRDHAALKRGESLKRQYGDRLILMHGRFAEAQTLLEKAGFRHVDGFVLDLGVSSPQLDEAARGFSFRADGPLDMRMDNESGGPTAADIVNSYPEKELADIIFQYGGERHSRRVARVIVERRRTQPFSRTLDLAETVRRAVPHSRKDQIDPATRTFQALRIAVNGEMDELQAALEAAEACLKEGGRLVIVSFHSLEDGMVKKFLQERSGRQSAPSRHLPPSGRAERAPTFVCASQKPVMPTEAEMRANPRARSAKLRCATRTGAERQAGP